MAASFKRDFSNFTILRTNQQQHQSMIENPEAVYESFFGVFSFRNHKVSRNFLQATELMNVMLDDSESTARNWITEAELEMSNFFTYFRLNGKPLQLITRKPPDNWNSVTSKATLPVMENVLSIIWDDQTFSVWSRGNTSPVFIKSIKCPFIKCTQARLFIAEHMKGPSQPFVLRRAPLVTAQISECLFISRRFERQTNKNAWHLTQTPSPRAWCFSLYLVSTHCSNIK